MGVDQITAGQVMKTPVLSVTPEDTLDKVLSLLIKYGISGVPVVGDNQELIGIITERDIIGFTTKSHVISKLESSHDEEKETVKIKEGFDLIYKTPVKKVMTKRVYGVTADKPVKEVAVIMNRKKITHIPVVDSEKRVIGIISRSHLIRHMATEGIVEQ